MFYEFALAQDAICRNSAARQDQLGFASESIQNDQTDPGPLGPSEKLLQVRFSQKRTKIRAQIHTNFFEELAI